MATDDEYFGGSRSSSTSTNTESRWTRVPEATVPLASGESQGNINTTADERLSNPTPVTGQNEQGASSDFEPNPLNSFAQVAYNFKFYTTGDGVSGGQGETIIAETGVTGFNIKEVVIDGIVAPNQRTKNTIGTNFSMTIVEPMGTNFLDAMYDATARAGISNWNKAMYWLELKFKGYQENGQKADSIASNYNNGTWKWRIALNKIDTHLDAAGGTYTITGIIYDEIALEKHHHLLQEAYSIEADDVQGFFQKLGENMTKTADQKYGPGYLSYQFKFIPDEGKDPSKWKITPKEQTINTIRINGMKEDGKDKIRVNLTPNTSVVSVVTDVIGSTEEGVNFIRDSEGSITDDSLGEGKQRLAKVFRVYPTIEITGYHNTTGNYKYAITYNVKGYLSSASVLKSEEVTDRSNSKKHLESIRKYGGLKKKYEYIYTGMNTEVIELDIKYDFVWQAVLPRFEGALYYNESYEPHSMLNEKAKKQLEAAKQANQQKQQANQDIKSASTVLNASNADRLSDNAWERLQDQLTTATQTRDGSAETEAENLRQLRIGKNDSYYNGSSKYAEAISGTTNGERPPPVPVSFAQNGDGPRKAAGSGLPARWDKRKSIYGAILDQVYSPITTSFLNISMTIKGDPFWLGTEYEKMVQGQGNPDFTKGDPCFALYFKYPTNVHDTKNVQFKDNGVFNGVYRAISIKSTFSNGQFTQTLQGIRIPAINPEDLKEQGQSGSANSGQTGSGTGVSPPTANGTVTFNPAGR